MTTKWQLVGILTPTALLTQTWAQCGGGPRNREMSYRGILTALRLSKVLGCLVNIRWYSTSCGNVERAITDVQPTSWAGVQLWKWSGGHLHRDAHWRNGHEQKLGSEE